MHAAPSEKSTLPEGIERYPPEGAAAQPGPIVRAATRAPLAFDAILDVRSCQLSSSTGSHIASDSPTVRLLA